MIANINDMLAIAYIHCAKRKIYAYIKPIDGSVSIK